MGTLRISCKDKKSKFVYKCKKLEAPLVVAKHLSMFSREKRRENGADVHSVIPADHFTAEWQDNEPWADGAAAETVPVLPIRS